eukprot:TRINITY_DN4078_c0_g1_i1.p1 TRINITY_DN4078_c0_g1~~TRINITY_DN4078_c0_g1_i1.p1  ORF type:complete len:366 (-),score=77.42 TRINITY_DN4078_c0_g1_i1:71-1168(-)
MEGPVSCPHITRGCRWQGYPNYLQQHREICAFEQLKDFIDEKDRQIQELREQMQILTRTITTMKGNSAMNHINLDGHTSIVVTLAVVNRLLFSGSMDGTLKVWNLENFTVVREASLGPVFTLKIASSFMFSGHLNSIKLWDLQSFECKMSINAHEGNVKALCVMGDRLFSGSSDRSIKVWNLLNGSCVHTLTNAHDGEIRDLLALVDSNGQMRYLLSASDDTRIKVWNTEFSGVKILDGHKKPIRALIAFGQYFFSGSEDTHIKMWNTSIFAEVASIATLVSVHSLAMTSSLQTPILVSGHADGSIKLWNVSNPAHIDCAMMLMAHTEPVRALIAEQGFLLSGGYDKTIKIWYPQNQKLIFNFAQ